MKTQAGLIGSRNAASQQPKQQQNMCNILGSWNLCDGDSNESRVTDSLDVPILCMTPHLSCLLMQRRWLSLEAHYRGLVRLQGETLPTAGSGCYLKMWRY